MGKHEDEYIQELRFKAEAVSRERNASSEPLSDEEIHRVLHELQVHQVELELQNEELREAQHELELSRNRFLQLFHKAPVGYLVLDSLGVIRQANETFCQMVQQDLSSVTNRAFDQFIPEPQRRNFIARYRAVFKNPEGKGMELKLIRHGKSVFDVRIETAAMPHLGDASASPEEPMLLIIVSDITEYKRSRRALQQSEEKYEQLYLQLDAEMNKARRLHERTLPQVLPAVHGLSFAAHYQPAQRLGGDFYDVIQSGSKLVIYLSDVTGHGLEGAMLSVFVKEAIDSYISLKPEEIQPGKILAHLHRQFRRENYPDDYFICIFLAVLDLGSREMRYSGAGFQDTPLLRQSEGTLIKLVGKGLFLAPALPDQLLDFHEDSVKLTPGSTVFFNTDGLTEQEADGQIYGERLPGIFYDCSQLHPAEIVLTVNDDFRRFNEGSLQGDDDITFLVMQVLDENG